MQIRTPSGLYTLWEHDYEWRLEGRALAHCWASGCPNPSVWDLVHFGCASPHCGRHPRHPRHPSAHEHYCHEHAIEKGLDPMNDPHIVRMREHPWRHAELVPA